MKPLEYSSLCTSMLPKLSIKQEIRYLLLTLLLSLSPLSLSAVTGERMVIEPSARVSWHELINIESKISSESPEPTVAPFMPTPNGHQFNPQHDSEQPADALLIPAFNHPLPPRK